MFALFFILIISNFNFSLSINPFVETLVDYGDNLQGFLAHPVVQKQIPKRPAIILFHAFMGRTDFDDQKARDLAKLGYVAFAADTYGKNRTNTTTAANFAMMTSLIENRTTILRGRIEAAWNYVTSLDFVDSKRVGSIGFCYGGLCTLDLARYEIGLKAAVSFHGTLTPYPEGDLSQNLSCAVQALHGDADTVIDDAQVSTFMDEMRNRSADWQFIRFAGAQHGFTLRGIDEFNIPGAKYNEKAANRSWTYMQVFFAEKLLQ